MESDDEYIHRKHFSNATCGVVYNFSANILYGDVKQIDATIYGGLSEHCTSMPLHISKDKLGVHIKPHGRTGGGQ